MWKGRQLVEKERKENKYIYIYIIVYFSMFFFKPSRHQTYQIVSYQTATSWRVERYFEVKFVLISNIHRTKVICLI